MVDLIKEYTVSEIVKGIKNTLEDKYFFIKIKGEITNLKKHTSGHYYFSLKDAESMINVVMFKNSSEFCKIDLQDGLEIIVSGKLTAYKERSTYQLTAEIIQSSGIGSLLKIIQERKEKLSKEGLFDITRKKSIPKLPKSAGIITSETGAALQDILSRLNGRTPISLTLYPVLVQGKESANEIINAIKYFNDLKQDKPKVIVITRGGGSIEDLMAFNDENLVRAIANSKIPTITAIGHEIDWTLADYASDLRLPTPTSVAEYLTITKEQALKNLNYLIKRFIFLLIQKNSKKTNFLIDIFNSFLIKKRINLSRNIFAFSSIIIRFDHIFKTLIQKYKNKKYLLSKIDINKVIKIKLYKLSEKIKIFDLKLQNYSNKYPILKDTLGKQISFKKDVLLNKNYILEFPDGNVKIKIIKI